MKIDSVLLIVITGDSILILYVVFQSFISGLCLTYSVVLWFTNKATCSSKLTGYVLLIMLINLSPAVPLM